MVTSLPIVIPVDPVRLIDPEVVTRFPAVANTPPLLVKVRFPLPVLINAPGNVRTCPAIAERPVLAPKVGAPRERLLRSTICTAKPAGDEAVLFNVTVF